MRRIASRLQAVGLASILAACGCSAAGCANQVRFHPAVDLTLGTAYEVIACLDEMCSTATLITDDLGTAALADRLALWPEADQIDFDIGSGDLGGAHHVSFAIRDADGVLLASFDDSIELESSQPNGPFCEPTCWGLDIGMEPAADGP